MKTFITAAAVAALGLTLAACQKELDAEQRSTAQHGGLIYANSVNGKFTSCSGLDSDNDGYVTCSYVPKEGSRPVDILCSYKSVGCKGKAGAKLQDRLSAVRQDA